MLVGGLRAGAGEGLASCTAVLGQQGADPAADAPSPCPQIGVIRCGRFSGGQVAFHIAGPALVGHGESLHEQGSRLQRDQAKPAGRVLHLARHRQRVIEPGGHRH
jgi:hypothetical protein